MEVRMRVSSGCGCGVDWGVRVVGVGVDEDGVSVLVLVVETWDGCAEDGCRSFDVELGVVDEDEEFTRDNFANSLARSSREVLQKRM
jgi:hypothetical protein